MSFNWNHRVVRHPQPDGSDWLQVHEVFYDNGEPVGCTEKAITVSGESVEELRTFVARLQRALAQPVLDIALFDKKEKEHGETDLPAGLQGCD